MKSAARAVLYARYSSDMQRDSSIDDQLRNCRRRVEVEGWTVTHVYADRAISGSDANRPDYRAMLDAAARGEFDVLVIDDLSRFSRDSVEQERAIRRLEFQQIRIISTSDGYDSTSKARKVHRGFKGLMNEIFLDDLRDKVHRGQTGQAEKQYWLGGRAYGFDLRPTLDPVRKDAYGQPERIGTKLEVNPEQAAVVQEIFQLYIEGVSCRQIAQRLNDRGVPSAGSTWKRKVRRCSGWAGSAVRAILFNPLYTGLVRWNVSQFIRNPDTGAFKRLRRPSDDVIQHHDESLRIVSDQIFQAARNRTRRASAPNQRLKSGGRAKYLLSGLLICEQCGAHYVMIGASCYGCGGVREGACDNKTSFRRTKAEAAILGPVHKELLAPKRAVRMAKELQQLYLEQARQSEARAVEAPQELQELTARIDRLRLRLRHGDPDMTSDELQAAIDRALAKRRELELEQVQPMVKAASKVLSVLPNAADLYRRQIAAGLDGDEQAATKARVTLRKLLSPIKIGDGENGSVWANFDLLPAALIEEAVGTGGRDERI